MTNPAPEKKIGKAMLTISWVIVLVGLTLIFGRWEDHQYNPNQSVTTTPTGEIVLQQNKQNHYLTSGLINGQAVVFMLDTGATHVAVPAALAQQLGLKPGYRHNAMTANGIVEVRDTKIATLTIGPITLHNVRASINPGMSGPEILLGMSALKDLELTQRDNTLTIKQIH